ncbi:hypothetical protein V6V89_00410 [Micromonospora sp. CPCC 206061]
MLVTVEPANTEKFAAVPRPTGAGAARAPAGLKTSNAAATAAAARPASTEGSTPRT